MNLLFIQFPLYSGNMTVLKLLPSSNEQNFHNLTNMNINLQTFLSLITGQSSPAMLWTGGKKQSKRKKNAKNTTLLIILFLNIHNSFFSSKSFKMA